MEQTKLQDVKKNADPTYMLEYTWSEALVKQLI